MARMASLGTIHDAARQAALDERDRLNLDLSDYRALRIAEAALAVVEHRTIPEPEPVVDVAARETT